MKNKSKFSLTAKILFAAIFGVFLGMSPLTSMGSLSPSSNVMFAQYCNHNIRGDEGLSTFCKLTGCTHATGDGSNVAPCGDASVPGTGG